jgi:hypothetical protein
MTRSINDLGETLLTQLNEIVTGGDDNVLPSPNMFVSWCQPGIPFEESDFGFCSKGIGGGADAEEDKSLIQQAFNFSQVIDFVPDANGLYKDDQQQAIFRTSESRLSHIYGEILNLSKVVHHELTAEEKEKLEKFRGLLWAKKIEKNLVTDEETERTVEGPVLQAYNDHLTKYTDAALLYNSKRIAAQGSTGPEGKRAVADWINNATLYRMKVKAAMDAWVSGGYRNEVDQMNAYINQVGRRDMMLWKQRLIENYEASKQSALSAGQDFFFSSLMPGNFATSGGWTEYSIYHNELESSANSKRKSWSAGGKMGWGLFSIGGGAGGSSSQASSDFSVSNFRMSFEIAQVMISRPWLYPEFFKNQGWTLRKGEGWMYDEMPSDGGDPPKGNFIGYPTSVIFARNINIQSAELASHFESQSSQVSGGGSVGWGPFRLSGSYGSAESSRKFSSEADGQSLRVPGMQIIGFVNHKISKAPNPMEGLKDSDFQ